MNKIPPLAHAIDGGSIPLSSFAYVCYLCCTKEQLQQQLIDGFADDDLDDWDLTPEDWERELQAAIAYHEMV